MKKTLVILTLVVLPLLLLVSVLLLRSFVGLYRDSKDPAAPTVSYDSREIETFIIDKWHFDRATMENGTLSCIRIMDLSLEEARLVGGAVFTGELAPESYLSQAATIEADVLTGFGLSEIQVRIVFEGNDGQEIFSVDSSGKILRCWEQE